MVGITVSEESVKDIVSVTVVYMRTGSEWREVSVYCRTSETEEVMIGKMERVLLRSRRDGNRVGCECKIKNVVLREN